MTPSTLAIGFIVVIILAAVILNGPRGSSGPRRSRRRDAEEASRLITQAEIKLQQGEVDAAFSLFLRALPLADGVAPLLFSEAYYGLARCAEKQGDLQYAAQSIRFALAYAPQWRYDKPAYEELLNSELRRVLDQIGKSQP